MDSLIKIVIVSDYSILNQILNANDCEKNIIYLVQYIFIYILFSFLSDRYTFEIIV